MGSADAQGPNIDTNIEMHMRLQLDINRRKLVTLKKTSA